MLTRRQIRVKVMQGIYALTLSRGESLETQEKFLKESIAQTYTLYLLILSLLRELRHLAATRLEKGQNKYLQSSDSDLPGPRRLSENQLLVNLSENKELTRALEKRKMRQWYLNEEYVKILYKEIVSSPDYVEHCSQPASWESDRDFVLKIYEDIIAPNDKVFDFLEDEGITWVDDLPLVNTFLVRRLGKMNADAQERYVLPKLLKSEEDMDFALRLLRTTLLRSEELSAEISDKTPNWDKDRIADIDGILLRMGIAELLYFPSIPERVTINEYLEIAKEYSTPKSSIFINGILDKLIREYKTSGRLKKTGRGLM